MSIIPRSKHGQCSVCMRPDTPCVKVAKDLVCLGCRTAQKNKVQIQKANLRNKVRSLVPRYDEDQQKEIKGTMELNRWFVERRKEMKGTCRHCNGKTQRADDKNFKNSIAHILPKAYFPSVATHEKNWIELCFYGNSCHTNMDNKMLDIIDLHCFDEVIEKFIAMYPFIDEKEKRRIPDVLLQYVKSNT